MPPLTSEQKKREQAFRQAGVHGDHKPVPAMIQSFQHDQHPSLNKTALLALAQLGATEALPEINALAQDKSNDLHDFAQAARARLIAESSGFGITDTQEQAFVKVNSFFQEIGKSPKQLTGDAKALTFPFPLIIDTATAYDMEELSNRANVTRYFA